MPREQFTEVFTVAAGNRTVVINQTPREGRSVFVSVEPVGVDQGQASFRIGQQNFSDVLAGDTRDSLTDIGMANHTDRLSQGMDTGKSFDAAHCTVEYIAGTETTGSFNVIVEIK